MSNDYKAFIDVCAEQLEAAVENALRESDLLSRAVVNAATCLDDLSVDESAKQVPVAVREQANDAADAVRGLLVHLQFADRLDQQVNNVRKNLKLLAEYMAAGRDDWPRLLAEARRSFTMEQERMLFDSCFAARGTANEAVPDEPMIFADAAHD